MDIYSVKAMFDAAILEGAEIKVDEYGILVIGGFPTVSISDLLTAYLEMAYKLKGLQI